MRRHTRSLDARRARAVVLAAVMLLPLTACNIDDLLHVDDVDVVSVPVFGDPENLEAVYGGTLYEFARAYGGEWNDEGGQILQSGMFADELYNSDNFTDRQQIDQRSVPEVNGANLESYTFLQRARNHAEVAVELLEAAGAAWSAEQSELLSLAGFTYVLFGENYCGGVPFSVTTQAGAVEYGAAETTTQIFQRAIARFDAALAGAGTDQDLIDLANIGKARALLSLADTPADFAAAAALVADVDTDYSYEVGYSNAVLLSSNTVMTMINNEKRWSVADNEGTNGLPFFSADDPRTPAEETSPGFNTDVAHISQLKYPSQGSDIPLATGIEARLIEAEAALQGGARGTFFTIHNLLRDRVAGLADLTDTGQSIDELEDLHFRERAFWLYLTSHRLGDLRRLVRQYDRNAADVYPIGDTVKGETRGNQVSLIVPFEEQSNPEYVASACNPLQP